MRKRLNSFFSSRTLDNWQHITKKNLRVDIPWSTVSSGSSWLEEQKILFSTTPRPFAEHIFTRWRRRGKNQRRKNSQKKKLMMLLLGWSLCVLWGWNKGSRSEVKRVWRKNIYILNASKVSLMHLLFFVELNSLASLFFFLPLAIESLLEWDETDSSLNITHLCLVMSLLLLFLSRIQHNAPSENCETQEKDWSINHPLNRRVSCMKFNQIVYSSRRFNTVNVIFIPASSQFPFTVRENQFSWRISSHSILSQCSLILAWDTRGEVEDTKSSAQSPFLLSHSNSNHKFQFGKPLNSTLDSAQNLKTTSSIQSEFQSSSRFRWGNDNLFFLPRNLNDFSPVCRQTRFGQLVVCLRDSFATPARLCYFYFMFSWSKYLWFSNAYIHERASERNVEVFIFIWKEKVARKIWKFFGSK